MVTITPTRQDVKEINFIKADSEYWFHDEFRYHSYDPMKRNLLETLKEAKQGVRRSNYDPYVGQTTSHGIAYILTMKYGFRDITKGRFDALPVGTYFTLIHDSNMGVSHLFFKGEHPELVHHKIARRS